MGRSIRPPRTAIFTGLTCVTWLAASQVQLALEFGLVEFCLTLK
jgi:hypothetical protein